MLSPATTEHPQRLFTQSELNAEVRLTEELNAVQGQPKQPQGPPQQLSGRGPPSSRRHGRGDK